MEYIDIHPILVRVFMSNMPQEILDISYEYDSDSITIQIIILDSYILPTDYRKLVMDYFDNKQIDIQVIRLRKAEFNLTENSWSPLSYRWLSHVLFSKAAIL